MDEFLQKYDSVIDYIDNIWTNAPNLVKLPAAAIFWLSVSVAGHTMITLTKRINNLEEVSPYLFRMRARLTVHVLKVNSPLSLKVSHKPLFQKPWKLENGGDIRANSFDIHLAGCKRFGAETKAINASASQWVEKEVLGKNVDVRFLANNPKGGLGVVHYGPLRSKNLNFEILSNGMAMHNPSAETVKWDAKMARLEKEAREKPTGIWALLGSTGRNRPAQ